MADEPKTTGNDQDTTPNDGGNGKTFTQAELDAIIGERLARERKNQPAQNARKPLRNGKIAGRTSSRSTFCKTGP